MESLQESLQNRRWPGLPPDPSGARVASPVEDLLRLQEQFRQEQFRSPRPAPPPSRPTPPEAPRSRPPARWKRWTGLALLVLMAATFSQIFWTGVPHVHEQSPATPPPIPSPISPPVAPGLPLNPALQAEGPIQPSDPAAFSAALWRLNRALDATPGSPEAVLKAIYAVHAATGSTVCNFEWTGGQPAFVYMPAARGRSLSESLNACAEAVERTRPAR